MSERITPEELDYIADMAARTGNYAAAVSFRRAAATIRELEAERDRLLNLILRSDSKLWTEPPCGVCGYSGPNYFNPDVHSCAGGPNEEEPS
jgi:hypothetical protein